jgi:hypothetical protein
MPRSEPAARAPVAIRIRSVPPMAGLAWIRAGFRLFARRPGGFLGLFGIALIAMLLLRLVAPPVVLLLSLALIPLISLGFMVSTSNVLDDLPIHPGAFLEPLRASPPQRRAQLQIGLAYVLTALAAYLIGDWIDKGEATRWMTAIATAKPDGTPPAPQPLSAAGIVSLFLQTGWIALVAVPLWHAPALVHWGRQRTAQAMFSSIVALWRTRAAFVVYNMGWWMIGVMFMFAISLIAALIGNPLIAVTLMVPVLWPLSTVFYITLWYAFVDTFEIRAAEAAGSDADA